MAEAEQRYADNAPGKFYVDEKCIVCRLCSEVAPHNFRESDDGSHDLVYKQPTTTEEIAQCNEALEQCPVEAIGSDGESVGSSVLPSSLLAV